MIALTVGGGGASATWLVSRPDGKVRLVDSAPGFGAAELSPDGRWLAQFSPRSVVIRSVPADPSAPIPAGGLDLGSVGSAAHWSADGNAILAITEGAMISIPIDWTDGTPRAGAWRKLFDVPNIGNFQVTSDPRRFLVVENAGDDTYLPVVLIQNWQALLGK